MLVWSKSEITQIYLSFFLQSWFVSIWVHFTMLFHYYSKKHSIKLVVVNKVFFEANTVSYDPMTTAMIMLSRTKKTMRKKLPENQARRRPHCSVGKGLEPRNVLYRNPKTLIESLCFLRQQWIQCVGVRTQDLGILSRALDHCTTRPVQRHWFLSFPVHCIPCDTYIACKCSLQGEKSLSPKHRTWTATDITLIHWLQTSERMKHQTQTLQAWILDNEKRIEVWSSPDWRHFWLSARKQFKTGISTPYEEDWSQELVHLVHPRIVESAPTLHEDYIYQN